MKQFIITFDSTKIVLNAKDYQDARDMLIEKDSSFIQKKYGNLFYYVWQPGVISKVDINEVENNRGIVSWVSH